MKMFTTSISGRTLPFRTAALAAILSATAGACATSQPNFPSANRSIAADDKQKAEDARKSMQAAMNASNGDPKAYTTAIDDLKNHRYAEVVDVAMDLLDKEIAKAKPNTFVLKALLDVISQHGGTTAQLTEFAAHVQTATSQLPAKLGNSWTFTQKEFTSASRGIASSGKPPNLPAPDTFVDWAVSKGFENLIKGTDKCLSDEIRESVQKKTWVTIIGRDEETNAGMDVLVRIKGKVPVYVGDAGVGKTAAAESVAYRILMDDIPEGIHATELKGAIVIQTTPAKISKLAKSNDPNSMAAAVEEYFADVKKAEKALGKKIIVFVDEAHMFADAQLEALKPLLESRDPIQMIWATTGKDMGLGITANEAIMRRIEPILLEEFDAETTAKILRQTWVPVIEKRYAIKISDDLLRTAIEIAPNYRPEVRRPSGPFLVLQDFAVAQNRLNKGKLSTPDERELLEFASKKSGVPVFPQDRPKFVAYMEALKEKLKKSVRGQTAMVDKLVDRFSNGLSRQGDKMHSVVMILGSTGVGKTMVAEKIAENFYTTGNRVLEIEMTDYMEKSSFSLNKLFGAPNGVLSSDKDKGVLIEFLEGRGKGGGVIILNEIEKAPPEVLKRLMSMFDKGEVTGGDGRVRKLGRSLVVMTSNKGATTFFPPEVMKGISRPELDKRVLGITKQRMQDAFLKPASFTSEDAIPREIVQRIDEWIMASPLLRAEALEIARDEVAVMISEHARNTRGTLKVGDEFAEKIVDSFFNESDGAREIKRQVRSFIENAKNKFTLAQPSSVNVTINVEVAPLRPTESKMIIGDGKKKIELEGPKPVVENQMLDPEFRNRMKNLEATLLEGIIDQDDAVKRVTNAIRSSASTPGIKSPTSIFLLGRTGTGKTEIGRRTAKARYGNDNAIAIIEMGKIDGKYALDEVFSPPKSIQGADKMGQFEKVLNDFPDGAVIVFDEISNAGGGSKEMKEMIAKYFYGILEEGTWSSPSHTYRNLNKYTFIFTGNDGEHIFRGLEDDDLLLSAWKSVAGDRKALKKMLTDAGFPEAFLGRFADYVMMKPPSFEAKERIAHKLVEEWKKKFKIGNPFEIEFETDFEKKLARLMYSSNEGARSISKFLRTTLGSLAAQSTYDFDWDKLAHETGKIKLSIEATSVLNPFYWLKPAERKATLNVEATQGKTVVYKEAVEFTDDANFMTQIRAVDAWGTAFHEAGHAVLNDPKVSGRVLEHLTIVPSGSHLGYARYAPVPGWKTNYSRDDVVKHIAGLLAGSIAEEMIGRPRNTGAGGDVQQARDILRKTAIEGSLVKELDGAMTGADGKLIMSPKNQSVLNKFMDDVMAEARQFAEQELRRQWSAMVAVSNTLMRKGSISGVDFKKVAKDASLPKFANSLKSPEQIKAFLVRMEGKCDRLMAKEEF